MAKRGNVKIGLLYVFVLTKHLNMHRVVLEKLHGLVLQSHPVFLNFLEILHQLVFVLVSDQVLHVHGLLGDCVCHILQDAEPELPDLIDEVNLENSFVFWQLYIHYFQRFYEKWRLLEISTVFLISGQGFRLDKIAMQDEEIKPSLEDETVIRVAFFVFPGIFLELIIKMPKVIALGENYMKEAGLCVLPIVNLIEEDVGVDDVPF